MNIDDYRAMKAQEEAKAQAPVTPEIPTPAPEQPVATPPAQPDTTTPTPEPTPEATPTESKLVIDGKEYTADEIKAGFMRRDDYTKKTQEVAAKTREIADAMALVESLKENPQVAQQLAQQGAIPQQLDPATRRVLDLEAKIYDMQLEQEINTLQNKYPDFELREVLDIAATKKMTNLEDAYLLSKSMKPAQVVDEKSLAERIRAEVLAELNAEKGATQSIITSNDAPTPVQNNEPRISEDEAKVARMFKMSPEDYIKWRDSDRRPTK